MRRALREILNTYKQSNFPQRLQHRKRENRTVFVVNSCLQRDDEIVGPGIPAELSAS